MYKLTKFIAANDKDALNLIREYMQVLVLKAIYRSKYGRGLSFMGGTCLRICHDLKRFSEDLDFTLDRPIPNYSFAELNKNIVTFLRSTEFDADCTVSEGKTVQKSYIKISKVLNFFGVSQLKAQKLQIKLEIDTKPVPVNDSDVETFFVTKFDEIFPILKHTDRTLFAGKICALLNRKYTKGRDFYDLIWYLARKTDMNINYVNKALRQSGAAQQFKNRSEVMAALKIRVARISGEEILKDIGRFLEDPTEKQWLRNYGAVFKKLADAYIKV